MLLDDIYVMWIPIVVIALMAALGYWRGVYRELIVSASIVLSALVAVQWATQDRWAFDLSNTFSGLGAGEWQFFLTLVLMGLIVAVVGYGLGGLFARRALSSTSRTLGALLGLVNGAALSGWVLRAAYEGLVSRQATSAVYQNPVSLSLMVWAGWFPVALAVFGAVAALVYSLTGDRSVPMANVGNMGNTAVHVSQPHAPEAYTHLTSPVYQPIVIPPAQARVDHFTPGTSESLSDVYTDAYSGGAYGNVYAPARDDASLAPTVANAVPYIPNYNVAPAETVYNSEPLPVRTVTNSSEQNSSAPSISVGSMVPSANSQSTSSTTQQSNVAPYTPPFGYDLAALWGQDEEQAMPDSGSSGERGPVPTTTSVIAVTPMSVERRCRNCGNILQTGAVFCTECGMRATDSI